MAAPSTTKSSTRPLVSFARHPFFKGLISQSGLRGWLHPALWLVLVALITRLPAFGNPLTHIDEQFYLLVGERMHQGALPYVDLWDRKPLGLFLIYAAARVMGGDGVLAYQALATFCAAATAFVIYRLAGRVAPRPGALLAATAYLLYLPVFNGIGGQSPVFYNLPVAVAALLTLDLIEQPNPRGMIPRGAAIMLLLGVAIQIKYAVVFEGIFLGLALLWRGRCDGWPWERLGRAALLWIGCALLPTALALGTYVALGHGEAFLQANFLSIFGREEQAMPALRRLAQTVALLAPIALAIRWAWRRPPDGSAARLFFLRAWAAAALGGYLLFGSYYDHYALPLLLPLLVLAAPALGWAGGQRAITFVTLTTAIIAGTIMTIERRDADGSREELAAMTSAIAARLQGGCLYVYEGHPELYRTTDACIPTRFAFPSHLNNMKEVSALDIDVSEEVRRILASKPRIIVMAAEPRAVSNLETRGIIGMAIARDYKPLPPMRTGEREWLGFERRGTG